MRRGPTARLFSRSRLAQVGGFFLYLDELHKVLDFKVG